MARTISLNICAPDDGTWFWRGEVEPRTRRMVQMLIDPPEHGAEYVLLGRASIPVGHAAPWHRHVGHEEFCLIISGRGEFWTEHARCAVGPGDVQLVAPNELHLHRQLGNEPLEFVWGYAPPGQSPS